MPTPEVTLWSKGMRLLGDLVADMWELTAETLFGALVGLIASPFVSLGLLFDLPNRLIERLGDLPGDVVFLIAEDILRGLPPDKKLNNRVCTLDTAVRLMIFQTAAAVREFSQKPGRTTFNVGFAAQAKTNFRSRIEDRLGSWQLSKGEKAIARILKIVTSPLKIVKLLLQLWDFTVSFAFAIMGGALLLFVMRWSRTPRGKDELVTWALSQKKKIRVRAVLQVDGAQFLEQNALLGIRFSALDRRGVSNPSDLFFISAERKYSRE